MPRFYTRRNNNRIPQHDYSKPGHYFVTICTQNRREMFGAIINNQMILNNTGCMVNSWWRKMFVKYKNISMNAYIVMPNHIHGIIHIVGAGSPRPCDDIACDGIGRGNRAPTIGHMVAYFKYQSTKQINKSRNTPGKQIWQRNYYDHIIRNDRSLYRTRQYIKTNPFTWEYDRENPNNRLAPLRTLS